MTTNALEAQLTADRAIELEPVQCPHHWVIQPASGPFSQGTCQVCGSVKEFKNYVEASTWGDVPPMTRVSADLARVVSQHMEDEDDEE